MEQDCPTQKDLMPLEQEISHFSDEQLTSLNQLALDYTNFALKGDYSDIPTRLKEGNIQNLGLDANELAYIYSRVKENIDNG